MAAAGEGYFRQQDPVDRGAGQSDGYRLHLLSSFLLRRKNATVTLPMGSQRLLAFLALQGPAPRCAVLGTLWPDVTESLGRGSLRTAMWRLHVGAPRLIQALGDMLVLRPDAQVDIHALNYSAQVILGQASQAPVGRVVLDARGDLLPGWHDDWVIFERERLRQLRLHALDALAGQLTVRGRYAEALEAAMESTRIEPLRESANRMIIAIHLAEDNVAEALRHYGLFRDLLGAELGIEPSARLTSMLPAPLRPVGRC